MADRSAGTLADLLHGAGRCLLAQHRLSRWRRPSPLDPLLPCIAGPPLVDQGPLRPWAELVIRSYWACGGQTNTRKERHALELAVAAFSVGMGALEILDDLLDGDPPVGGSQGPNLALACIGESMMLLSHLPSSYGNRMVACWGESWARCAAAQAQDMAYSRERDLTMEQAIAIAEGCGSFTRWGVEAGAAMAGTRRPLRALLAEFGQELGTAEKLLHDIHDLWPGSEKSRDVRRPSCNLTLVVLRLHNDLATDCHSTEIDEEVCRRQILESGALHYAWACADQYRLQAADALERFAYAGGDAEPLAPMLALSPELDAIREHDVVERIALTCAVP